ncbi:MAG TPA: AAA-associated domain-containing protein [Vicinamibacteria bacterium]|nr:AAA-associated domain-containing protein [Vicinamibacteria bacterium]
MPQHLEPLPHAPIGMVLGLLEHLKETAGGREDLYKLGGPLGYELDDLLPVTEAAKRLGLVTVTAGDIELTEEGRRLAAAEEPERKRRLAHRLGQLPLIAEIRRAAEEGAGRAPRSQFLEELQDQFSPVEAQRQLSTALDWARYGELFDFDPDSEDFVLAS